MKFATNLGDNSDFNVDLSALLSTHTFIQGMTGSTKTNLILKLVELVKKERPDVQMVFLDDQEEYTQIPNVFKDFKLIDSDFKFFSIERAQDIGMQSRRLGRSIVVKLDEFEDHGDREKFVAEFIKGFTSLGKEVGKPVILFIDEADQYCPTKSNRSNIPSRYPIINMMKRARKQNISIVLATQFLSEVEIRARRECANRICGKTTELRDRRIVAELLADPKIADELFDLRKGEFYVRGEVFPKGVSKIHVEESTITKKQAGVANVKQTKITSNLDDIILENAVDNRTDQTLDSSIVAGKVIILEEQIADLKKQLTDEKIKSGQQFSEGFLASERNWKDKSKIERLLK